jgi:hypothetical protein
MKYKLDEYNVAISDTGVLFNMITGESFEMNQIGMLIIEKIRKNYSKEQIKEVLLSEFDIDRETMERNLEEFLHSLIRHQMVELLPQD